MSGKKRFFTKHVRSSAAVLSLGIHAALIIVAVSFVAVTVVMKDDQNFKVMEVKRPRMQLKKLQVPVNMKKAKANKPKLRKRIVSVPKLKQTVPDIKMPEITGIKGGTGNAGGGGLGGSGSLGFSMAQFEIFGIKGKGEKVFLILDSSYAMMYDEMGGIPAYKIIKDELIRIVDELSPATIFNVAVFGLGRTYVLFPEMAPANEANTARLREWLGPLNAVSKGMGDRDFGTQTLGPGGSLYDEDLRIGNFMKSDRRISGWYSAAMLSMMQRADSVFLLTNRWGGMGYAPTDGGVDNTEWKKTPAGKKWEECFRKGLKMLDEENRKRAEKGDPPKVLQRAAWAVNAEYFPHIEQPPRGKYVRFTPEDFVDGFSKMRARSGSSGQSSVPLKSGLSRRKRKGRDAYSFNVVRFVKAGETVSASGSDPFKRLTAPCDGEYKTLAGLAAIQSYAVFME